MDISRMSLRVLMPDGTQWDVPVMTIARNRAENYKDEFDNDVERSLKEDTLPLFENSSYEIVDWAVNNMNWDDVKDVATEAPTRIQSISYQDGWLNGSKVLVEY